MENKQHESGGAIEAIAEVDSSTLAVLNRSEIDQQIATAHKFPRSIKRFRDEALSMVTLSQEIAQECIYAIPREGKMIEGPSARFAEVVASAWGNCRAGARTVSEEKDFVVAQGAFHDLERNVAITYEVKRRITNKYGKRYGADMIGVTANAACSIALRNAVLKGVPKAFWKDLYDAARKTIMGDSKTLATRRADAVGFLGKFGVTEEMILKRLGVAGIEDVGLEELVTLRGLATAIKDGDTTMEQAFEIPQDTLQPPKRKSDVDQNKPASGSGPHPEPGPDPKPQPSTEKPQYPTEDHQKLAEAITKFAGHSESEREDFLEAITRSDGVKGTRDLTGMSQQAVLNTLKKIEKSGKGTKKVR